MGSSAAYIGISGSANMCGCEAAISPKCRLARIALLKRCSSRSACQADRPLDHSVRHRSLAITSITAIMAQLIDEEEDAIHVALRGVTEHRRSRILRISPPGIWVTPNLARAGGFPFRGNFAGDWRISQLFRWRGSLPERVSDSDSEPNMSIAEDTEHCHTPPDPPKPPSDHRRLYIAIWYTERKNPRGRYFPVEIMGLRVWRV